MKFIIGVHNDGNIGDDDGGIQQIWNLCREKLDNAMKNGNENIEFRVVDVDYNANNTVKVSAKTKLNEEINSIVSTKINKKTRIEIIKKVIKKLVILSANYASICNENDELIDNTFDEIKNRVTEENKKEEQKKTNVFRFDKTEIDKMTTDIMNVIPAPFKSDEGLEELQVLLPNITNGSTTDFQNIQKLLISLYNQKFPNDGSTDFTKAKLKDFLTNEKTVEEGKVVIYICPESDPEKKNFKEYIKTPSSFAVENNYIYNALFHSTEVAFWVHQSNGQEPNNTTLVYVPDRPPHPFELKFKTVNTSTSL